MCDESRWGAIHEKNDLKAAVTLEITVANDFEWVQGCDWSGQSLGHQAICKRWSTLPSRH